MPQVQPPGPLPPPPPPPPPPAPNADSFRTTEYNRMGALDQVHAADAYALGYTGAGVIVGVVDFNFQLGSSDVNYHPDSVGPNAQAIALYEAQIGEPADTTPHGHAIAGLIAAKKDDTLVHGIAFDAQVLAVDYFSNVNETQISQGGVLYHVSDPWAYITSRGAKILNVSFGYDAGDIIPNPPQVSEGYVVASPTQAVANGALLVASAGNSGGLESVAVQPGHHRGAERDQQADDRTRRVHHRGIGQCEQSDLVVLQSRGQCERPLHGRAGRRHHRALDGRPWASAQGTSFSAPMISGAAALILDRWPSLTGREIADILFQSATDLGSSRRRCGLRARPAQCASGASAHGHEHRCGRERRGACRSTRPASCSHPPSAMRLRSARRSRR